jgi:DNA topoisomerase-1
LIWRRFVASQMKPAVYLLTEATIRAGRATFSARGRELKFDGYTKLTSPWAKRDDVADMLKEFGGEVARVLSALKRGGMRLTPEGADVLREAAKAQPEAGDLAQALAQVRDQVLPPLVEKEPLQLHQLDPVQHFTEPPPRYTEASLVRTLEKHGIGRPSTYAPIITTIQDRGYAVQDDRKLRPTELGELVTEKLVQHFHDIMDTGFTGEMEEKLDLIEDGKANWVDVLRKFYDAFVGDLDKAQEGMESVKDVEPDPPVPCDKCQRPMIIKWNRYGRFYGCRAYPECRSAKPLQTPEAAGEKCERCGADMYIKSGRFGRFLACSKYPDCKNTRPIPRGNRRLQVPAGWKMTCPQCTKSMWVKHGRRGPFIACEGYPDCKNTERVPKEWFVTIKPDGAAGAGPPEAEEPDDESEGENGQG